MRLVDARRLTGRNLLTLLPAVAAELAMDSGDDVDRALTLVREELQRALAELGLPVGEEHVRRYAGGATYAMIVAEDVLHACADALEWAAQSAIERLAGRAQSSFEPVFAELKERLAAERNAPLLALREEAERRDVPMLWDEDAVALGFGVRAKVYPPRALPQPQDVPWAEVGRVPTALVTGTNGKTTTTRFLARMVGAAGRVCGATSTDGLLVGGEVVEPGDWSGPGGARRVLRHAAVQTAILETARGGLLRRGLAVDRCDVAVVTNVGEDHFGEYGVMNVADMADVKCLVGRVVVPNGRVVLNADDPHLMRLAGTFTAPVVLFSLRAGSADEHLARGGEAWLLQDGALVYARGPNERRALVKVDEIPLAFGGSAAFNVQNALAAAAAGNALGLPWSALADGLRGLMPTSSDSLGRSNVVEHDGVRLLLDFAHNPASVHAALSFLNALSAREQRRGRLIVVTGHAGDRSDDEIRAVARTVHANAADVVIARDLPRFLRGRAPGEVPAILREEFRRLGHADIAIAADDVAGLSLALDGAQAGDTVALFIHVDRELVREHLRGRGWPLG